MTRRFSRRDALLILTALVAVLMIFWLKSHKTSVLPPPELPAPAIDYSREVKRLVDVASLRDNEAFRRFETSLATVIASYEPRFSKAADAASGKASEYESIAKIIYYLAWDQATDEHRTDEYLTQTIGPIIDPVVSDFGRDVGQAMDNLENELRKNTVQLAIDLAALGPGNPPPPQQFEAPMDITRAFDQALGNLGLNATGVGVSVAFDAFAVANSRVAASLLNGVASLASRMFAKQVAKVAASAVLVVADGPLPIGDILALAGLVWTGYDIVQMQNKFRDEIQKSAAIQFRQVRDGMRGHATTFAEGQLSAFVDLQSKIGSRALTELSKQRVK